MYGLTVLALAATLVGCGAAATGMNAAGDKAGGAAANGPVVLHMLNPAGGQLSQNFVNEVQDRSNGRIKIEVTELWHMDGPDSPTRANDVIDAVRAGEAPLGVTGASAFHNQGILSFDALAAPLLIDRTELQTAILRSDIADDMLRGLDASGLVGIGILPGALNHPWGAGRHLLDAADYGEAPSSGPRGP